MNKINKVLYINLEHRTDRKEKIEKELEKIGLLEKSERFDAIKNKRGALGCALSHIACLERAQKEGWNNILIIEDDNTWSVDKETLDKNLQNFFVYWISISLKLFQIN